MLRIRWGIHGLACYNCAAFSRRSPKAMDENAFFFTYWLLYTMNMIARVTPFALALSFFACGGTESPPGGSGGTGPGAGGTAGSGGLSGSGGASGSGGSEASGGASGGAAPSTGGAVGSGGGLPGSGGSVTSTGGFGGDAAGGAPGGGGSTGGSGGGSAAVFSCPSGSESLVPSLDGKTLSEPIAGVPEIVNNGGFLEGPVWFEGKLYLSQLDFQGPINGADLLVYTPGTGFEVFIDNAGTNGLALAAGERLVGASQVAAGVISFDLRDPSSAPLDVARMYMGQTFNSPNDVAVRSDGTVYFSDPNGNCGNCMNQTETRVYRVPPGGAPEPVAGAPSSPNGVTLSPDESVLYLGGNALMAFEVQADGSVGAGTTFGNNLSGVDGMVVDCAGNLYVALHAQNMIVALDSSGTQLPGSFSMMQPTNLAFGGPENKTLYVTGFGDNRGQLRAVELEVPGFPY